MPGVLQNVSIHRDKSRDAAYIDVELPLVTCVDIPSDLTLVLELRLDIVEGYSGDFQEE